MKIQWILAALLVAVVVFVATYLKMYTESSAVGPTPQPPKSEVTLFFPKTIADSAENNYSGNEWESGLPGHYDFWFQNPNEETVTVGLNRLGCARCTRVAIALESAEYRNQLAANAAGMVGRIPGVLDGVAGAAAGMQACQAIENTRDWHNLAEKDAAGFEVPAQRAGWIRVDWNTDKKGPDKFIGAIWTSAATSVSPLIELSVPVMLVPPVGVLPTKHEVGTIGGDKPRSKPIQVLALSATRRTFKLEALDNPYVEFTKPKPLTLEQCRQESERLKSQIIAGYHVSFIVKEMADTGKQLDLGPQVLKAFLKTDVSDDTVSLVINVTVRGDVNVVSGDGRDKIDMGLFDAAIGETKEATLETHNLNLDLAFDSAPAYLKVDFSKEAKVSAGIKAWRITVTVPGRAAAGAFPRDNKPYDDSAIYLKLQDPKSPSDTARRIRIPVSGQASSISGSR